MNRYRRRALGQNFLVNRDIAQAEAEHAHGKRILEIGPGHGILTSELCERAKSVIAVEKDPNLFRELKNGLNFKNLELINADFLKSKGKLKTEDIDMVISNIPYSISSEVIGWLVREGKEAVLCLQKEFVERMLAKEGTSEYSKLSVFSALSLSITEIMDVPSGNFNPKPEVDSEIIYIKPRKERLNQEQEEIISALMQHKKRTVRKALIDSRKSFGLTKEKMSEISELTNMGEMRVFNLSPKELLGLSDKIMAIRKSSRAPVLP